MITKLTFNHPLERFHKRKPVELNFKQGINILVGPNGCGKTTTLSIFEIASRVDKKLWTGDYDYRDYFSELECKVVGSINPCISYDNDEYSSRTWLYDNMNEESLLAKFSSKGEGKELYQSEWVNRSIPVLNEDEIKAMNEKGYEYSTDNFVITCDEPENSLDFINQKKFVKWLDGQSKATPQAQILVATHCPFIIDYALKHKDIVNLICFNEKWLNKLINSYSGLFEIKEPNTMVVNDKFIRSVFEVNEEDIKKAKEFFSEATLD